jgi:polysaccharide pyruvyl transferase WcaK-like protein
MDKILIINEGFSSNLGDQAIQSCMNTLIQELGFDTEFRYFSNPALTQLPVYDYEKTIANTENKPARKNLLLPLKRRLIPYVYSFRIKKQIKAAIKGKQYKYVIIGGGQLINSSKKSPVNFFAIAIYWWVTLIKKYTNANILIIAAGAAGSFKKREFNLYKKAFESIQKIWVRDAFSQKVLLEQFKTDAALLPDIAFYNKNPGEKTDKLNMALVGIYDFNELKNAFETGFKNREAYYEFWYNQIKQYRQKNLTVKLFYTTLGDAVETRRFKEYILQFHKTDVDIIPVKSLQDLLHIFKQTSYVYSARMHALILALKNNCKVEVFPISQKLISFEERYVKNTLPVLNYSNEIFRELSSYFNKTN